MFGTPVPLPISAASLPLPTGAATLAGQTQPGVDIGDVTVNNAAGAAAVNIQDGGNSITVDGTISQSFYSAVEEIQRTGMLNGDVAYVLQPLGRRSTFTGTTAFNDVKEFDTSVADFVEMTGAEALEIHCSSATDNDVAGGAVRKVKITYIDNAYNIVESAAISLNGGTVALGFTMLMPLWMEAVDWGSGGVVAAGNILLRTTGPGSGHEQITLGGNKSLSARFMVPDGYTGYMIGMYGAAIANTQDIRLRATVSTLTRSLLSHYLFHETIYCGSGENSNHEIEWMKIPARAKIKVSTITGSVGGTVRCDAHFTIVLVAN